MRLLTFFLIGCASPIFSAEVSVTEIETQKALKNIAWFVHGSTESDSPVGFVIKHRSGRGTFSIARLCTVVNLGEGRVVSTDECLSLTAGDPPANRSEGEWAYSVFFRTDKVRAIPAEYEMSTKTFYSFRIDGNEATEWKNLTDYRDPSAKKEAASNRVFVTSVVLSHKRAEQLAWFPNQLVVQQKKLECNLRNSIPQIRVNLKDGDGTLTEIELTERMRNTVPNGVEIFAVDDCSEDLTDFVSPGALITDAQTGKPLGLMRAGYRFRIDSTLTSADQILAEYRYDGKPLDPTERIGNILFALGLKLKDLEERMAKEGLK